MTVLIVATATALAAGSVAAEGTFFKNRKPAEEAAPAGQAQPQAAPQAAPAPAPEVPESTMPAISGVVEQVVATDTFMVGGTQVMLHGVLGEPSPYVEALAQWLASNGNQMSCEPAGGRYRCAIPGGVDVGLVVIANGAGKAGADAPPEYQNAEQQARAGRVGVWQ
jgi:endonuclease YncB( thermonuclease family)